MLVFIGYHLLSSLRWIPMCQGFSHFWGFSHYFVLANLASSIIRVKVFEILTILSFTILHLSDHVICCFWILQARWRCTSGSAWRRPIWAGFWRSGRASRSRARRSWTWRRKRATRSATTRRMVRHLTLPMLKIVIWIYDTFGNNLTIEKDFAKYLIGSCC